MIITTCHVENLFARAKALNRSTVTGVTSSDRAVVGRATLVSRHGTNCPAAGGSA
jgi:hypothetical protein